MVRHEWWSKFTKLILLHYDICKKFLRLVKVSKIEIHNSGVADDNMKMNYIVSNFSLIFNISNKVLQCYWRITNDITHSWLTSFDFFFRRKALQVTRHFWKSILQLIDSISKNTKGFVVMFVLLETKFHKNLSLPRSLGNVLVCSNFIGLTNCQYGKSYVLRCTLTEIVRTVNLFQRIRVCVTKKRSFQ